MANFYFIIILAIFVVITGIEAGILRPELGAYLKDIGTFNPSTEEIYATFVVPIPRLPAAIYDLHTLDCNNLIKTMDRQNLIKSIDKRSVSPHDSPVKGILSQTASDKITQALALYSLRNSEGISICEDYNLSIKGMRGVLKNYEENINRQFDTLKQIEKFCIACRDRT
jgi:hypothetical protein